MALRVLDGNQSATTLSSVVTGGEHIVAHTVVSLGSTAIANITSAVSGIPVSGTVTANLGNVVSSDSYYANSAVRVMGAGNDGIVLAGIDEYENPANIYEGGKLPISGTVTANVVGYDSNYEVPMQIPVIGFGEPIQSANIDKTIPVQISNTNGVLNSDNPLPISGTVTASLFPQNGTAVQVDGGPNDLVGVRLGYNSGGTEFAIVSDEPNAGLPIQGTVTANTNYEYVGGEDCNKAGDKGVLIGYRGNGDAFVPADLNGLPISGTVTVGNSVTIGNTVTVAGTVTANSSNGTLTTRFGTPTTASTAFLTTAVTNTSRKYLLIQNVTTQSNVITVGVGFVPTTTQGIQLTAGAGITFESSYIPTGAVWVLSSVTASNYTILEA